MTKQTAPDDDFMIFERWDSNLANDGVVFSVFDGNDNHWGDFKCGLFDANVPRIKHAVQRSERKARADAKARGVGKNDQAATIVSSIDLALDTFLLGWTLKGRSGNLIPFNRENAIKYFGRKAKDAATGEDVFPVAWVLDEIFRRSQKAENFQPDDVEETGEPAGN